MIIATTLDNIPIQIEKFNTVLLRVYGTSSCTRPKFENYCYTKVLAGSCVKLISRISASSENLKILRTVNFIHLWYSPPYIPALRGI